MLKLKDIQNHFDGTMRSYPLIIVVYGFVVSIIFRIDILLFFSIYTLFVDASSHYIKEITKFAYEKIFKTKTLPILGRGIRPDGAKYCGSFIFEDNLSGVSRSYGMPSGHSVIAFTIAMFWSLYIMDRQSGNKKWLSVVLLNICCVIMALSRVYLGCHTIQQVIVGSLLGLLFGFVGYKIYSKISKQLKIFK